MKSKEARRRILELLFKAYEADGPRFIADMWKVGEAIGLDRVQTEVEFAGLEGEGLVDHPGIGGVTVLTHAGVDLLERPDGLGRAFPLVEFDEQADERRERTERAYARRRAILTALHAGWKERGPGAMIQTRELRESLAYGVVDMGKDVEYLVRDGLVEHMGSGRISLTGEGALLAEDEEELSARFPESLGRPVENLCFVLMPFRDPFKDVYESAIRPAVQASGLECLRADEMLKPRRIMDDILESIMASRVLVADLTERNPNVFYELGWSHALGKDVVLLTQKDEDVPFDLRDIRYIRYSADEAGLDQLRKTLAETLIDLLTGEDQPAER